MSFGPNKQNAKHLIRKLMMYHTSQMSIESFIDSADSVDQFQEKWPSP